MSSEKIPTKIFTDASDASSKVALEIAQLIKVKAEQNEMCVLGLATGSTPISVYNKLVEMHQKEGLSFKNVITFNLDEYYPMKSESLQSYVRFMNEHLFDLIDIDRKNVHIPDGMSIKEDVFEYCTSYENKIKEVGGIDLQILGIGRTGHIGFNEPGSGIDSITRLITLDQITITDAASDFYGEENVPLKAITMGVATILSAKKILILAWGENKSHIVKRTIEGEISDSIPATYLQKHGDVTVFLDNASCSELTRVKTPWLIGSVNWDENLIKKAVIWLSHKVNKPILKLTNRDYGEHGMIDLITEYDTAYNINIGIFKKLQNTITGYPAGKLEEKQRIVLFSPHPDDDVISMGGTFIRLVDHGHDVHVAYQTSGNIAVFDEDMIRFVDFLNDYNNIFELDKNNSKDLLMSLKKQIENRKPGEKYTDEILKIKALIRRGEAKAACRYVGLDDVNAHFLDMPFYQTGMVKKKDISEEDVQIIVDLLTDLQPSQIYAAGDLSDPHGTHRVCLKAIFEALDQLKKLNLNWLKNCKVWLYRGAWQEWGIEDIDMAIPISPDELLKKRRAIFKHQSQKDRPLFPGHDAREFWQRSEARNRKTAIDYDKLGLPEYEAIEAFKEYFF